MADYYDNSDSEQRFQPGTTVRADEVDGKFDEVATGFSQVADDVTRALKLPEGTTTDQVITQSALNRRNLTLGFDSNGNLTLRAGLKWEGDWQASTAYIAGDFVRAPNNNLYVCDISHTSAATFEATNWALAVDIGDLELIQTACEAAQNAAKTAETNAETAESGAVMAKNAAETALDAFTDLYLGSKTADPTTDNDGDALQAGALYYNSTSGALRLYTGSAWTEAAFDPSGALVANNNLSDLDSAPTARTNLGLGSAAVQADTRYAHRANNLSDLADTDAARSNLGAQASLVSGTSIKTVNSTSLLGAGDVSVQETLVSGTNIKTVGGTSLLGSGNISIVSGDMGGLDRATASQIRSMTGDAGVTAGLLDDAAALVSVSNSWSPTWTAFISAEWTLGSSYTLGNPSSVIPGTTRVIKVRSSSSVSRSVSFGSAYKAAPSGLAVTNTEVALLTLFAVSSSEIVVSAVEYTA